MSLPVRFFRERFGVDDRGLAQTLGVALEGQVDAADLFFEYATRDAVVLEEGIAVEAVEPESPRAIDAAIDYLSSQSFDTLRQPGSKTVVRNELSTLIREAFEDEMVMRVLLTTFVMQ